MKILKTLAPAGITGFLLLLMAPAPAQGPPQGFAAQGLMRGGGMMGTVDPMRSHAMELLQPARTDVRSELHLDIKQKAALDELMDSSRNEMRERMRKQFQSPELDAIRKLPQEEQRARMQEFMQANRAQMMAEQQAWQGELTEKVKAILRPTQIKRMGELDLQYRGVFALTDQKIAEQAKITQEHQGDIAKLYGDFQSSQQQLVQEVFQKMREEFTSGQGAQTGQQGRRPAFNPQEMQNRMQPVMRKIEAQKKEAEEKALAVLSPEEKQGWAALQGEKFTFRKEIVTNGPRGNF